MKKVVRKVNNTDRKEMEEGEENSQQFPLPRRPALLSLRERFAEKPQWAQVNPGLALRGKSKRLVIPDTSVNIAEDLYDSDLRPTPVVYARSTQREGPPPRK